MTAERKNERLNFEFPPDDKIDNSSYELVRRVFGQEEVMLTNRSTLRDFVDDIELIEDEKTEGVGKHKLTLLSNVPEHKKHLYEEDMPDIAKPENYFVWYPPLSEKEQEVLEKEIRRSLINKLESTYGISFEDYPKDEELYVWKVARFAERKKLKNIKENQ